MTKIDQFESVFKSADKPAFSHEAIDIRAVLTVCDLTTPRLEELAGRVKSFLGVLDGQSVEPTWPCLGRDRFTQVDELLQRVEKSEPDLICSYRNLHISATEYPYSLGVYIDVLTQATKIPVMLLPGPESDWWKRANGRGTKSVMAVTDHLAGDHHLVSYAAKFVHSSGKLMLAHVEDEQTFERYVATISRIPAIDTDSARELILEQLLKEPRDYIGSCREVLEAEGLPIEVEESITLGHHLSDYKRLVEEHEVDLIVMNTKDEDQLAMHGLAYPLSVELRETPLLLL